MFKAIFFFFSWLYFWTVLNGIIFYGVESNKSCVVCQIYSILSGGVLLVILFVLFSSKQVSDWRNIFALRKTSPLKVILFSFFSVLYVITVYLLFHQNGGLSPSRNDGYHLASILLVTLVLAPIFEELMFRGVLYSYISNGLFKDTLCLLRKVTKSIRWPKWLATIAMQARPHSAASDWSIILVQTLYKIFNKIHAKIHRSMHYDRCDDTPCYISSQSK